MNASTAARRAAQPRTAPPTSRAQPRNKEAVQPELRVVEKPRRALRRTSMLVTIFAVGLLFSLVGLQALIVQRQGHIDDLGAQVDDARRLNQELRLEVASLESPDRIRTVALERLGMIVPDEVTYLEPIHSEELTRRHPQLGQPEQDGE